jgi:hypothetical protein
MKKICYICDLEATSKEHAPPKSFFPIFPRKNLITIPSCEEHNLRKNLSDDMVRTVLALSYGGHKAVRDTIYEKVLRSLYLFRCKPPIKNLRSLWINGSFVGSFEFDKDAFDLEMDGIARALYFHTYGQKYLPNVTNVYYPGMNLVQVPANIEDVYNPSTPEGHANIQRAFGALTSRNAFRHSKHHGDNPKYFYYQIEHSETFDLLLLRMMFYQGFEVVVSFLGSVPS